MFYFTFKHQKSKGIFLKKNILNNSLFNQEMDDMLKEILISDLNSLAYYRDQINSISQKKRLILFNQYHIMD